MTDIRANQLRFSGQMLAPSRDRAKLFLPGYGGQKVSLEYLLPGQRQTQEKVLSERSFDGHQWNADINLPLGTAYRFKVNDQAVLDTLEVTDRKIGERTEQFNLISPNEINAPQLSPATVDILSDSLTTNEQFRQIIEANYGTPPMRTHANQYGGDERGLMEIISRLHDKGVGGLLFKPFIGGDNISSHKYWTVDPFVLNNSFSQLNGTNSRKVTFRDFLNASLRNGMKIYADGAFVNQGLNGVQFLSLMAHGFSSPYWNWFTYQDSPKAGGPLEFPKHAFEKFTLGILPTKEDPARPGHRQVNYERIAFRIINDPKQADYRSDDFSFIECYDPLLETADGHRRQSVPDTLNSESTVQPYRFPIKPEELQEKREALTKLSRQNLSPAQKHEQQIKLFSEWKTFRMTAASLDDSTFKWDGQIDVAKMNLRNPEVVAYLDQAVGYWSRLVMNTHTRSVTTALKQAQENLRQTGLNAPAPLALVKAITASNKLEEGKAGKLLTAPVIPEQETLTKDEANAVLRSAQPVADNHTGTTLADTLLKEYPLSALELPIMFKSLLSYPGLQPKLAKSSRLDRLITLLSETPGFKSTFGRLKRWIPPRSFQARLAREMNETAKLLSPAAKNKLHYENIQSLVAESLAEKLFIFAFTGQNSTSATPKQIEEGLLATVPKAIRMADPQTATELLPRFLKKRLKEVDKGELARLLESELENLDPQLAALAKAVVQKRELGLNWRIDAAKDVGNMDQVRNADPADRAELFKKEIDFVQDFWSQLGKTIRGIFPKAALVAELTDFDLLSGHNSEVSQSLMNQLFASNTFTSTPNMSYIYSQIHQLMNFAQRPDEFGAHQKKPNGFIQESLLPMSKNVSFPALRQYQNLPSSHDYMTTSHALLVNPHIFTQDHERYFGLTKDLQQACDELTTKACFEPLRAKLGINNLGDVLGKVQGTANNPNVRQKLSPSVRNFIDQHAKENSGNVIETPAELRPRFISELLDQTSPQYLGITPQQHADLKAALTARINEPSEAKAMRAVIVNILLDFDWNAFARKTGLALNDAQATALGQAFKEDAWQAMDKTIQRFGRHYGYQPLDLALAHLFQAMDNTWESKLPEGTSPAQITDFRETLKAKLYSQASRPVMDKLLRIFATLNAIPGVPSVYLPDLFAQGGGELIKNMFVQNRNLIRVDKLESDPEFKAFFEQVGRIFNTRQEYASLHNGVLLPVEADDHNGIMPVIRDNGHQQIITLINTGNPTSLNWDDRVGPTSERYAEVHQQQTDSQGTVATVPQGQVSTVQGYKPKLSSPNLVPGTVYKLVRAGGEQFTNEVGKRYRLEADGHLSGIDEQGQPTGEGLNFTTHCMLVRES